MKTKSKALLMTLCAVFCRCCFRAGYYGVPDLYHR